MNDGELELSFNMCDAPSMRYNCDMCYSSSIGGSGEYAAQYEMDLSNNRSVYYDIGDASKRPRSVTASRA